MDYISILKKEVQILKEKSFVEFDTLEGNVVCYSKEYNDKSYIFEIHTTKVGSDKIYVMLECSRNIFFISMFSKQIFFSIDNKNHVVEISGDEYYKFG